MIDSAISSDQQNDSLADQLREFWLELRGSFEDRAQGLRLLMGQFFPGDIVSVAHAEYKKL